MENVQNDFTIVPEGAPKDSKENSGKRGRPNLYITDELVAAFAELPSGQAIKVNAKAIRRENYYQLARKLKSRGLEDAKASFSVTERVKLHDGRYRYEGFMFIEKR